MPLLNLTGDNDGKKDIQATASAHFREAKHKGRQEHLERLQKSSPDSMRNLQQLDEEEIHKIIEVLTQLILLSNPEAKVSSELIKVNADVRIIYNKQKKSIKIKGSFDGKSGDIPKYAQDMIFSLHPEILKVDVTFTAFASGQLLAIKVAILP